MMDPKRLYSLLTELVQSSDLQPKVLPNGEKETYCNFAVFRMASYFGCHDFTSGPNANAICSIIAASRDWQCVSGSEAQGWAHQGGFAIAGKQAPGHGHVAVVMAAEIASMRRSPSWGKLVPWLANVGASNGIKPASECFPVKDGEPRYYTWLGCASY